MKNRKKLGKVIVSPATQLVYGPPPAMKKPYAGEILKKLKENGTADTNKAQTTEPEAEEAQTTEKNADETQD